MYKTIRITSLLLIFLSGKSFAQDDFAEPVESKERLLTRKYCEKIAKVPLIINPDGDMRVAWRASYSKSRKLFLEFIDQCKSNHEDIADEYISQLQSRPSNEAINLLLGGEEFFFPMSLHPFGSPKEARNLQIAISEYQLLRMKEREYRQFMYQVVAWRGKLIDPKLFSRNPSYLESSILKQDELAPEQSWYNWRFLFLLMATDREDMLEDIYFTHWGKEVVHDWIFWFRRNKNFLVPSTKGYFWELAPPRTIAPNKEDDLPALLVRPHYPFANWDNSVPILPGDQMPGYTN